MNPRHIGNHQEHGEGDLFMFAFIELVASLAVLACLWLKWKTDGISIPHALVRVPPDAVLVHTYKPTNGEIPDRGQAVLERGWLLAEYYKRPLLLVCGHTVPGEKRTEGAMYRDYALRNFGDAVNILLGEDPAVRDTAGETKEAIRIARTLDARHLLVIASRPHLYRVSALWQNIQRNFAGLRRNDLYVVFYGEQCPAEYYLWEFTMLILEKFLPVGSRRRDFVLNLVGRRG